MHPICFHPLHPANIGPALRIPRPLSPHASPHTCAGPGLRCRNVRSTRCSSAPIQSESTTTSQPANTSPFPQTRPTAQLLHG
jgi:hypothetical protein